VTSAASNSLVRRDSSQIRTEDLERSFDQAMLACQHGVGIMDIDRTVLWHRYERNGHCVRVTTAWLFTPLASPGRMSRSAGKMRAAGSTRTESEVSIFGVEARRDKAFRVFGRDTRLQLYHLEALERPR
jgi:hypothetical protein